MVDFKINNSRICEYHYNQKYIGIGGFGFTYLTDTQQDIYISDVLTHEFIHYILHREFNLTLCKLFDVVGDKLRDVDILNSVFEHVADRRTWSECILVDGFNYFLEGYHIDKQDVNQAYIICGSR